MTAGMDGTSASNDRHCLLVTKLLPIPADNGGKLRTLALLERLAASRPVSLVALDEGDADVPALRALGIDVRTSPWRRRPADLAEGLLRTQSISSARFWQRTMAAHVQEVAAAHPGGTIVSEFVHLDPWIGRAPARRRVLATQNIESALTASLAETATGLRRVALQLEAKALARNERRVLRTMDVVGIVSEADRVRLGPVPGKVVICPNGQQPADVLPWPGARRAVFVAHMGWSPNVDAAQWLVQEVWGRVVAKVPDAELVLVGRSPAPEVRALAGPGIEVTGTVPEVAPHLQRASVALAPLRAGGGTRLKILEALGVGRPVVATTVGAEGLEDLAGSGLLMVDDPEAMATAIAELLLDPARAEALGRQGHAAVNARYSWDATLAPLLEAIDG
jgi:hypothetical protein